MIRWRDIDIELDKKYNGDILDLENEYAIGESLRNIFLTMQGQRRWLSTFAMNGHNIMFQPVDNITAKELGDMLYESIQTWDNRINIRELIITPFADQHRYDIRISFNIQGVISPEVFVLQETIYAI